MAMRGIWAAAIATHLEHEGWRDGEAVWEPRLLRVMDLVEAWCVQAHTDDTARSHQALVIERAVGTRRAKQPPVIQGGDLHRRTRGRCDERRQQSMPLR